MSSEYRATQKLSQHSVPSCMLKDLNFLHILLCMLYKVSGTSKMRIYPCVLIPGDALWMSDGSGNTMLCLYDTCREASVSNYNSWKRRKKLTLCSFKKKVSGTNSVAFTL
jgi:hypothetical protein